MESIGCSQEHCFFNLKKKKRLLISVHLLNNLVGMLLIAKFQMITPKLSTVSCNCSLLGIVIHSLLLNLLLYSEQQQNPTALKRCPLGISQQSPKVLHSRYLQEGVKNYLSLHLNIIFSNTFQVWGRRQSLVFGSAFLHGYNHFIKNAVHLHTYSAHCKLQAWG